MISLIGIPGIEQRRTGITIRDLNIREILQREKFDGIDPQSLQIFDLLNSAEVGAGLVNARRCVS
jgi:hypothetical protein